MVELSDGLEQCFLHQVRVPEILVGIPVDHFNATPLQNDAKGIQHTPQSEPIAIAGFAYEVQEVASCIGQSVWGHGRLRSTARRCATHDAWNFRNTNPFFLSAPATKVWW